MVSPFFVKQAAKKNIKFVITNFFAPKIEFGAVTSCNAGFNNLPKA